MEIKLSQDQLLWISISILYVFNFFVWFGKLISEKYMLTFFLKKNDAYKDMLEFKRIRRIDKFRKDETVLVELWHRLYGCLNLWNSFLMEKANIDDIEKEFCVNYDSLQEYLAIQRPFLPKELYLAINDILNKLSDNKDVEKYDYSFEMEKDRIYKIYNNLLNI